jgi:DNA-binding CsgD family transcriptional regulator
MLSHLLKSRAEKPDNGLTPREENILELVGRGYKNSEIASSLFISQETVRWHKRRLYRKIGRVHGPPTNVQPAKIPPASRTSDFQPSPRKAQS